MVTVPSLLSRDRHVDERATYLSTTVLTLTRGPPTRMAALISSWPPICQREWIMTITAALIYSTHHAARAIMARITRRVERWFLSPPPGLSNCLIRPLLAGRF